MNKTERRTTYVFITISMILGLSLVGIGIYMVPSDCELIGDDTAGMHSICIKCENEPQPCLDEMGNLGARIIAGLGFFMIWLPPLYPFIEDFQRRRIVKNKLFDQ